MPAAALQGFVLLSFIILLHEQVHHAIFAKRHERWERLLGILYALPTGICASQFKRWHLDHHGELGSATDDPKRAYLTPKMIKRWYKALYMTPALFVIYSIASSREARCYPGSLRRAIAWERLLAVMLHLVLAWILVSYGGWGAWGRVHIAPLFLAFPFAFTLNRLGQHYYIDPADPAKWSTLVNPSPFWNWIFLYSNLHLEHHYLVGVPCYNLPALNKLLQPFYRQIQLEPMTYRAIMYHWFVRNAVPHTKWNLGGASKS